jgi:Rhs element Vgr protein
VAFQVNTKISLGKGGSFLNRGFLSIQESLHSHHTFQYVIPLNYGETHAEVLDKAHEYIGQPFKCEIDAVNLSKDSLQYKGVITSVQYQDDSTAGYNLVVKGHSPTILLDDHKRRVSFLDLKLKDIVDKVVQGYPKTSLNLVNEPTFKKKLPYCIQYSETPYAFLSRLADKHGEWFYYNGENVVFGGLKRQGTKGKISFGDTLTEFQLQLNALPLKGEFSVYDYLADKSYSSKSQADAISGLDKYGQQVKDLSSTTYPVSGIDYHSPKYQDKADVEDIQRISKQQMAASIHGFNGRCTTPKFHVGDMVEVVVDPKNKATNKYTIVRIHHYVTGDGTYNASFSAIPSDLKNPPTNENVRLPNATHEVATVVSNEDSDGMGRIKVRFPWMEKADETPWLRGASMHAHKDRGFYFIPEVDDQVLVGFESGDPDCPLILGSLYHSKAKPMSKWKDSKNDYKVLRTKSGNEIFISDQSGKEMIQILNPKQTNMITLKMDGNGLIRIESKGDIELESENIYMKAKNIEIKADQDLKTQSTKLENKAQNADIKVDVGLNIQATNTEISNKAQCKISGNASVELSSSGINTIKGSLVKIN